MTQLKKILIADGAYIENDFFEQDFVCNGVEEVWIENDFEKDIDISLNFGHIKSLERFRILNPQSPYYVEDGLLYMDIVGYGDTDDASKTRNLDNTFYRQSNLSPMLTGKVLISIPPAITRKDIVIPEGVVAIARGAIMNCHLDSLTLPWSLHDVEYPIIESEINELLVHNWGERTEWNYASINSTINIIRTVEGDPLNKYVERYWSCDMSSLRPVVEVVEEPTETQYTFDTNADTPF